MNAFQKLTKTLIQNKLWLSEISYDKYSVVSGQINREKVLDFTKTLKVVVKNVNKSYIDGVKVLNTDISFVIDALSIDFTPETGDIVNFINENTKYKVILAVPLGILDGQPTAYEIVIRLA